MWYKFAQSRKNGFKVVGFTNGIAFSLANRKTQYSLEIGNITGDTFLGTNEQFCLDYYGGIIDEPELLLTYSYDISDIISGNPDGGPNGGEVRVRKARLESFRKIPKDVM